MQMIEQTVMTGGKMVKFYVQLTSFSLVKALHVVLTAICIIWARLKHSRPLLISSGYLLDIFSFITLGCD